MERYRKIQNFVGGDLFLYALDHYGREYANALIGFLSDNLKETLSSCRHNRDRRTMEEYAQDIVVEWILEDNICEKFNERGISCELIGADKKRELLKNSQVKATADFLINGKPVELVVDFSHFWKKTKKLHLRDNKFKKLLGKEASLLAIDIIDKTFQLIQLNEVEAIEVYNPAWGKKTTEIKINPNEFQPFDMVWKQTA